MYSFIMYIFWYNYFIPPVKNQGGSFDVERPIYSSEMDSRLVCYCLKELFRILQRSFWDLKVIFFKVPSEVSVRYLIFMRDGYLFPRLALKWNKQLKCELDVLYQHIFASEVSYWTLDKFWKKIFSQKIAFHRDNF